MSLHENNALHILHVLSVMIMLGTVFFAFAGSPEARKRTMMWSGIASLLALLTGIRMWQGLYHFSGKWVLVKLVCWLGLSALTGIAYKRKGAAKALALVGVALSVVALYMVYYKPF
ncbi:MAG: hypothetical protein QM790_07105 [Nibricoccus sp.]